MFFQLNRWKLKEGMFRAVFWVVHHDGSSTHLWNVGRQSFYTAVQPRRQLWTSYSPPWELEISHEGREFKIVLWMFKNFLLPSFQECYYFVCHVGPYTRGSQSFTNFCAYRLVGFKINLLKHHGSLLKMIPIYYYRQLHVSLNYFL
jgi:hypothetical protein